MRSSACAPEAAGAALAIIDGHAALAEERRACLRRQRREVAGARAGVGGDGFQRFDPVGQGQHLGLGVVAVGGQRDELLAQERRDLRVRYDALDEGAALPSKLAAHLDEDELRVALGGPPGLGEACDWSQLESGLAAAQDHRCDHHVQSVHNTRVDEL